MSHKQALEDLKRCVARGPNYLWFGARAFGALRGGVDHVLVERVLNIVIPWSPETACKRLHDEYAPIAWRVLAKAKVPRAAFLVAYAGGPDPELLRAGAAWLVTAAMVDATPKNRARLPGLCADHRAIDAARATVVEHGGAANQLLAVLAHDGAAESVDALVDVVYEAITARGPVLDTLFAWFVPFARGTRMTALAGELTEARDRRGIASPLGRMFGNVRDRLALNITFDSRQARTSYRRKASAWIVLSSHALPNAAATITWNLANPRSTRWEDGKTIRDHNRLGSPTSVDDIPRWLAASAATLGIRWDPRTVRITSNLRGAARRAAVEWLLPPPPKRRRRAG